MCEKLAKKMWWRGGQGVNKDYCEAIIAIQTQKSDLMVEQ